MEQTGVTSGGSALHAAVAELRAAACAALAEPAAGAFTHEVPALLLELAAVEARVAALSLRVIAQAEQRGLPAADRATSTAVWLRHLLRLAPGEAATRARLARSLDLAPDPGGEDPPAGQLDGHGEAAAGDGAADPGPGPDGAVDDAPLPGSVGAALRDGRVSLEQAGVMARTLASVQDLPGVSGAESRAGAEAFLLEHARQLGPDQLAVLGRYLLDTLDRAGGADLEKRERAQHAARAFSAVTDYAGMLHLRGALPPEPGALLLAVLDPLAAPHPAADGTRDPRTATQRRADALIELTKLAAASGQVPVQGGNRACVLVTMTLEALRAGLAQHATTLAASHGPQPAWVDPETHALADPDARTDHDTDAPTDRDARTGTDAGAGAERDGKTSVGRGSNARRDSEAVTRLGDGAEREGTASSDSEPGPYYGAERNCAVGADREHTVGDDAGVARDELAGGCPSAPAGHATSGAPADCPRGEATESAGTVQASATPSGLGGLGTGMGLGPGGVGAPADPGGAALGGHAATLVPSGQPLSAAAARRLACDAELIAVVLGSDSQVLDIGRATRQWTWAQQKAVAVRDGGCIAPGCDRPPGWCQLHHIRYWSQDGATAIDNAAMLCDAHHDAVHHHGWTITMGADGHPRMHPPAWMPASAAPLADPHRRWRRQLERLAYRHHKPDDTKGNSQPDETPKPDDGTG